MCNITIGARGRVNIECEKQFIKEIVFTSRYNKVLHLDILSYLIASYIEIIQSEENVLGILQILHDSIYLLVGFQRFYLNTSNEYFWDVFTVVLYICTYPSGNCISNLRTPVS